MCLSHGQTLHHSAAHIPEITRSASSQKACNYAPTFVLLVIMSTEIIARAFAPVWQGYLARVSFHQVPCWGFTMGHTARAKLLYPADTFQNVKHLSWLTTQVRGSFTMSSTHTILEECWSPAASGEATLRRPLTPLRLDTASPGEPGPLYAKE